MERSADIDGLVARMEALLVQLRERGDGNRHFLATYPRRQAQPRRAAS
jgi:hypothetical protein